MPAKNYYRVLGVPRHESPAGIRSAYYQLARRTHPDVVGGQGTAAFQEIHEAYSVLSDASRRRAHDRECFEAPQGVRVTVSREPAPEAPEPEPISMFGVPLNVHPSFDALRERYLRNFTGRHVPKAERAESLTLDALLSPEEAFLGCDIPVGVPVFRRCAHCGGEGRIWTFLCLECRGAGIVEETRTLWVRVPPMVRPGAVLEFPLESCGISNLYLRVRLSVLAGA